MIDAATLVFICKAWLTTGLLVGAVFIAFVIDRVDSAAQGSYVFRLLLLPGLALLWPVVVWRSARLLRAREQG